MAEELWRLSAREAVARLKRKELTPLELIDAAAARIERVEPQVNALPILCLERARAQARRLLEKGHPAEPGPGYLYGLPVVVKDTLAVAGVRHTEGSPIYADRVAAASDVAVQTLEANGAIPLAKSNIPEFAAGINTFNEVFGATRNPFREDRTVGGSSGGSAAALLTGEAWLATGSDLGGSLRVPAAFCNVVGLRPSPGRVAHGPAQLPFEGLSVDGPMGRDVLDCALLLDAMAGQHPRDPLSLPAPARHFFAAAAELRAPRRIAFSPDLGGITPVARELREIYARAARAFEPLGARVEEASPDLHDADEIFQVLRAAQFATTKAALLRDKRDLLKPELVWNIERGLRLTSEEVGRAALARGALYQRMVDFFERYDLLLCPATAMAPYPWRQRYVTEVDGVPFDNYIAPARVCYAITLTACPALSLPCGFTAEGLPVGLQVVGPPRGEARLLAAAAAFEATQPFAARAPMDPLR
jgi:amidase